ncbi:Tudor domain-containing protein 5 [Frankliniella fusca]|uniref:Tudor domain-containing protein 5 n=1 Tax=Frankliniella fusca TaxID=407009 RepID=A0AAE1H2X9_9NEOP|nr:Tudor domain-containing protein 5 [Frankliniella fusca]
MDYCSVGVCETVKTFENFPKSEVAIMDLDTIKIVLRSLLISTQNRLTVHDLQRDYRLTEGHECPYSALGYRSFLAFLQSMPDTVTVLSSGEVKAVSTKDTAHIQRLVALQKSSKKKRRPTSSYYGSYSKPYGSGGGGFYAPRFSGRGKGSYGGGNRYYGRDSGVQASGNGSHGSGSGSYGGYSSPKISEQSRYRENSYPSHTIEEHFQKVREVKEQARARDLGATTWSNPVNIPSPAPPPSSCTVEDNFPQVKAVKEESSSMASPSLPNPAGWSGETFIKEWQKQSPPEDDTLQHRILPGGQESSDESDDSFYERFHDPNDNYPVEVKPSSPDVVSTLDNYIDSSSKVNETVKHNLKNLIKSYPSGLWACLLPEKYEELFGVNLNWNELGFDSLIQMARDLPDVFVCKRVKSGDWMLFDVSNNVSVSECCDTNPVITVPQSVKKKVFDIVERYTSGIRGEQLAQLYEEYYGRTLIAEAPGFKSLEDFFSSIHNTVIRVRYIRKECFVYPGEKPEVSTMPCLKVDLDEQQLFGLFPEEVMGPGEMFHTPVLPSSLEPGQYIELRVAEVYNPQKFWIMLRKSTITLNQLMDELQDFYHDHGAKYVMPDCTIKEGQSCVAIYDSEWHRAVIKTVGEPVEVVYVDYGTVSKCPRKDLRFIHKDFAVLPKQAIRSSLSGIQPPIGCQRFTKEASYAFLNLVLEKELIGLIHKLDLEEPYFELFLIDTNGETDVHLNDVLVGEGHASFKDDLLETAQFIEEINGELQVESDEDCQEETSEEENRKEESCREETSKEATSYEISEMDPVSSASQNVQSSSTKCPSYPLEPPTSQNPHSTSYIPTPSCMTDPQATPVSHVPPPGFGAQKGQSPASDFSTAGSYPYMVNPFNPLVNPALANAALATNPVPAANPALAAYSAQGLMAQTNDRTSNCAKPVESRFNPSENSSSDRYEEISKGKSSMASDMDAPTSSSSEDDFRNRRVSRRKKTAHSTPTHTKPHQKTALYDSEDSDNSVLSLSCSSFRNVTPDLVQSVGNLNLSQSYTQSVGNRNSPQSSSSTIVNFWQIVEIEGKALHLFNIDEKAYVSTGELARKFTQFSTCDTLVRVLKNMDINPPYSKLNRQEKLPLFSALDGYEEDIKLFDLIRNKNGSVIGTFHLTPLTNVPSMIIALALDASIVNEFRHLRDSFNPNDRCWID